MAVRLAASPEPQNKKFLRPKATGRILFSTALLSLCKGSHKDNNILEGQIRSIALGRLNHMFAGSHRGGELAAVMYSFMATCKLQNIDPAKWLDDVLRRIPGQAEDKLRELLPQFWKPLNAEKAKSA